jgi:phosphopantetheinyl transferase
MSLPKLAAGSKTAAVVYVCSFRISEYLDRFGRMLQELLPGEQVRAQRFYNDTDRRRFVLGRAIIRRLCGSYLNVESIRILLDQTACGKLYLNSVPSGREPFEFNISHSGAFVLVAWSEGQPVGVDVEAVDQGGAVEYREIARVAFSDTECAVLSAACPGELRATFYRIWVRKEAVLKGEGCGFAGELRSFSVVRRHTGRTEWLNEVRYPKSGRKWRIIEISSMPDHVAALAFPQNSVVCQCTPQAIDL